MPAEIRVIENETYDVVDRLEATLARAKRGELVSVGIATVDIEGTFSTSYAFTKDRIGLVGALGYLIHRIHRRIDEE